MSGNVHEWCQDWYGDYSSAAQTNPTGASSSGPNWVNCRRNGPDRVNRGGSWWGYAKFCRSSSRGNSPYFRRSNILGLRLALSE